jgi:putative intracellular protease/amidase
MLNVGVFIYDKAEELDFVGPFEVFQAAGHFAVEHGLQGTAVLALHVVSRIYSRDVAEKTAAYMEYHWDENPARP